MTSSQLDAATPGQCKKLQSLLVTIKNAVDVVALILRKPTQVSALMLQFTLHVKRGGMI